MRVYVREWVYLCACMRARVCARLYVSVVCLTGSATPADRKEVAELSRILESGDTDAIRQILPRIERLNPSGLQRVAPAYQAMLERIDDPDLHSAAQAVVRRLFASSKDNQPGYPAKKIQQIAALAELRATGESTATSDRHGRLRLTVSLRSNGANYLLIEPSGSVRTTR